MLDEPVAALEKIAVVVAGFEQGRVEARTRRRAPPQPHRAQARFEDGAELFGELERNVAGVGNGPRLTVSQ